ncbi:hypothetical protein [Bosea sp. RAC05]|uniref:hypothetical protein n=1 Tax=Bosea sp. RAC05 TaxID=1842539 RepID=UPI0008587BF7|nr:hypothetical protein [Bosea sp. RAC05]AOG02781.1 hypothetical protein BSY19_5351 [Bosea sp. RAC05]
MTHISDEASPVDRVRRSEPARKLRSGHAQADSAADAILERGRPWYFDAPSVLQACARITLLPFSIVIRAAEAAVALAVLGLIGIAYGWYSGLIHDQDVIVFLRPIGQRILAMIQQSGSMP